MEILAWLFLAAHSVVVLIWVWGLFWARRIGADANLMIEPRPQRLPDPDSPSLAVYIAAHNEQDKIESCLAGLLYQNYANLQVVIVSDRSEDETCERVRAVMEQDARVRLVEVAELPHGRIGKAHALAVATENVSADYLLFMDCDCRLKEGTIAAVMQKVAVEDLEFASLWPSLQLNSTSERLLTPPASWLLGLWAVMGSSASAANSEIRLGNGQFMLFSCRAYEQVGGHAAVQAELAEDLALARKIESLGVSRWHGFGRGLYVTTRDNSLSGASNALTRVLIGSLVAPWRILASTQLLSGGVAMPLWVLPISLFVAIYPGWTVGWAMAVVSCLHILVMARVVRRALAMTLEDSPSVWSFMVGAVGCAAILYRSWFVTTGRGRVRWGKTSYRVRGSQVVDALPDRQ